MYTMILFITIPTNSVSYSFVFFSISQVGT